MGLAPYGTPVYQDVIMNELLDLKEDGSFRLDLSYFNYCQGLTMTSRKFDGLFGGPPRTPETPLTQLAVSSGSEDGFPVQVSPSLSLAGTRTRAGAPATTNGR